MRRALVWTRANIDVAVALAVALAASLAAFADVVGPSGTSSATTLVLGTLAFALMRIDASLGERAMPAGGAFSAARTLIRRNMYSFTVLTLTFAIAAPEAMNIVDAPTVTGSTLLLLVLFVVVLIRLRSRIVIWRSMHGVGGEIGGAGQSVPLDDRFTTIGSQLSRLAGELNVLQAEVQARAASARRFAEESSLRQAQAERDRRYAQKQHEAVVAVEQLVRARAEPIIEAIVARSRRDQLMFLVLGVPIGIAVNILWHFLS